MIHVFFEFVPRRNGCEFAQMKVTTSKITWPKLQKLLQDWILNENGLSVEPQSKTIWQNYGLCFNGQAKQNMAWIGKCTTMRLSDLSMMAECRDITGIFQYYIFPDSTDFRAKGKRFTGCFISGCMKTNAYQTTKTTLLGHKKGICTFLRCGHLIFNHSFLHFSMNTYVKCTLSFGPDFVQLPALVSIVVLVPSES